MVVNNSKENELSMLVEAVSNVSREEIEWLEEFNRKRIELAEATRRERIMKEEREAGRAEGRVEGRVEGRAEAKAEDVLAFCDILSPKEIASRLKMDLEKVNEIINSK